MMSKRKRSLIKKSDYGTIGLIRENRGLTPIAHQFMKQIIKNFPHEKDDHAHLHVYSDRLSRFSGQLKFYIDLFAYMDLNPRSSSLLQQELYSVMNPEANRNAKQFEKHFRELLDVLKWTDPMLHDGLRSLSKIECVRLNEAMRCLGANCYLGAVVMAVSAVESRLHSLLLKVNKKAYRRHFEKATLGSIVALFRKDSSYKERGHDRMRRILPDKHKPLMEMLNIYRIFSAHPRDEKITYQTAKCILELSFLLLVDPGLKT